MPRAEAADAGGPGGASLPADQGCSCEGCRELSAVLADPERESWSLRAAQHQRSHVETTIVSTKPDLTCAAERKGSPHTLICTKSQASFERRVERRRNYLADQAPLEAAGHGH